MAGGSGGGSTWFFLGVSGLALLNCWLGFIGQVNEAFRGVAFSVPLSYE